MLDDLTSINTVQARFENCININVLHFCFQTERKGSQIVVTDISNFHKSLHLSNDTAV